ncbi:MAG: MCE family protein [Victivallales bacterium]|nr:MCE family protein [Victivallales bacterium]
MENDRKYTLIGAVVLLAIFIFVILLSSLGGHGLLTRKVEYTLYFDKSVKGLSLGAPVMFRGIRIGKVDNIKLISFDDDINVDDTSSCPVQVTIEIEPEQLDLRFDNHGDEPSFLEKKLMKQSLVENWMFNMVKKHGMAAKLQISSLLTGQLYIALDIAKEGNNDQKELAKLDQHIIPTRNTAADDIYLLFEKHNMTEMANKAMTIVNDFISSGKAKAMLENAAAISEDARQAVDEARKLLSQIGGNEKADLGTAVEKLNNMLDEANGLLQQLQKDEARLAGKLDDTMGIIPDFQERMKKSLANIDKLVSDLNTVVSRDGQLPRLLDNADGLVKKANGALEQDAPAMQRLNRTLDELDATLRSLREFTDMLSRRPEVLIRGK